MRAVCGNEMRTVRLINTWTVNNPYRAAALVAMGVRGIITDVPDKVIAALGQS